mmetsp:Transcript_31483/g.54748  ORF Transcript_31483/g.54748 Transcript_31483/m.54748 type:complete len:300 (+) Transcript_31483:45-944(+)
MNQTSSFQERGPNLMAARDSTMNRDEDERAVRAHDSRYSTEFDLCENYQNAVDCLIQCEYIIKTQQEQLASQDDQLASKDEHIASLEEKLIQFQMSTSNADDEQIASLEEKLIQMSFELASSKAFQDEQLHQFKRRISSIENSSVEDKGECAAPLQQQQQQTAKKNGLPVCKLSEHSSQSSLDDSYTSRWLSNIGQYLQGLNKNITAEVTSTEGDAIDISPCHVRALTLDGTNRLQSSSGPLISGVLFPVSTREVLAGFFGDKASGGSSTNNANEEWPQLSEKNLSSATSHRKTQSHSA